MGTYRVHVQVEGRVQGVGYRMFVRDQANRFRADGWVRNREDGSVEAEVEGEREIVDAVIEEMHARGSYIIRVDRMTVNQIAPRGDPGFIIR